MNVNPAMPMNAMGGPVGAPVPMMNNGAMPPQAAGQRNMQMASDQRTLLNTYIYEYFIRNNMYDCARQLLTTDPQMNVAKDGANRRRDENGNPVGNGLGDDPMDTDSKEDVDSKIPEDLPAPKVPNSASETSFLYEWFCLFWDIFHAQRTKGGNGHVHQYVSHTQQQSRMRQNQQQDLLRGIRPDSMTPQQQQFHMMRMQQGMNMKPGLHRAAMANSQNNPQAMMLHNQTKQNQMQRDPSDMDGNRPRPASPGSSENAPSPSKRPRLDGPPFNTNQPGMAPNGAPRQGMPGQQQFTTFSNQPPQVQAKSIATYAANLQQHQASQMPNKSMPNSSGPPGQASPMMQQGPDQAALTAYYNTGEMGQAGMRPGPGGPGGVPQAGGGSNHALQDYQMQLMLLEQQNKKRLMMARQEQDNMGGGMPRGDGPPGPGGGPTGQPYPDSSPQGARTGASPNPADQMKRGTPQMNNAGIPSPLPEGASNSRGSPVNFIPANMDPNMNPNFFTKEMQNMGGNMVPNPQGMNGMRGPGAHPGGPQFNGQMNPQMLAAARQQQQQQGGPGVNPQQWQQGPNGQMVGPGGMPNAAQQQQQQQQQQRAMPPPSAPAAAAAANAARTNTSSPQQPAAPPTPSQANKAAPKKKDTKASKSKAASQKKSNSNLNAGATPAAETTQEAEAPTPATPITPVNANANATNFNKNNQNTAGPAAQAQQTASAPAPAPMPPAPVAQPLADASQNGSYGGLDPSVMGMEDPLGFTNPLISSDVLNDFDFDSFLHEDGDNQTFDFNTTFSMEGPGEIGAE